MLNNLLLNNPAAEEKLYVEDVFSTYLYQDTNNFLTVNNGIALASGPADGTVLHLTGDTTTDVSPVPYTLTLNGNTQVSTSVKKYGTGSLAFDGSGDWLTAGTNTDWNWLHSGTEDWTVECWLNIASVSSPYGIICTNINSIGGAHGIWIGVNYDPTGDAVDSGVICGAFTRGVDGNRLDFKTGNVLSANQWNHVAICFNSSTKNISIFVNGTSVSVTNKNIVGNSWTGGDGSAFGFSTASPSFTLNVGRCVGSASGSVFNMNGYIDDLRLTRRKRRYTSNFTAPTAALPLDTFVQGKGGMVWLKQRGDVDNHRITDTVRGAGYIMSSNNTTAQYYESAVSANVFYSDGFRTYSSTGQRWVSWTFRKAAKFFDVVSVTGQATQTTFNHSLGVAPGFIVIRERINAGNWFVYHRSTGSDQYLQLETSNAQATFTGWCTATSTTVTVKSGVMGNGNSFVVYLFAHDPTADGIIQCGSYTGNGTSQEINLGWEAQWLLQKRVDSGQAGDPASWFIIDSLRGMDESGHNRLTANNTNSETRDSGSNYFTATANGFKVKTGGAWENASGGTYIYVAIRRGPMRTPTSGTSVFQPIAVTASTGTYRTTNFPVDLSIAKTRDLAYGNLTTDRLRGYVNDTSSYPPTLVTSSTAAESTSNQPASYAFDNTGYRDGQALTGGFTSVYWNFRRAPSFFDQVCYTGDGTNGRSLTHNLGVAPEMVIVKDRNAGGTFAWFVGHKDIGSSTFQDLQLRSNAGTGSISVNAFPSNLSGYTATTFIVNQAGLSGAVNGSGTNYVSYLFATCPGVSKVGSYTGNGSSQTINCGFSAGARFVMIKRTDSAGDWYVWDTARGIVAGNDPHLSLNLSGVEVTTNDTIDPDSTGFVVNQVAATNVNVNGATYIYLAIA